MLWVMLFVLVVTIYFLAAKWNNIYGIVFGLEMLAIELLLFVLLQSSFSFSAYYFETQLEYFLYRCIRWMNISFFKLNIIVNVSICLYLFANTILYIKSTLNKSKKRLVGYILVWIFSSMFVFIFNSHTVTESIYLLSYDSSPNKYYYLFSIIGPWLCQMFLFLYSFIPIMAILYRIKKTNMQCRKKVYISLLGMELILICLFIVVLWMPPIKYFFCNGYFIDFSPFDNLKKYHNHYWFICVGILLVIFIIRVSKKYNILSSAKIVKKVFVDITDVRYVFHTYKNVFFSISAISGLALKGETIDDVRPLLMQIHECADNYMKHVGTFLDIENIKKKKDSLFDVVGCIEKSEEMLYFPENIRIEKIITIENGCINGDAEGLTECICNLLNNSIDAICNKECEDGIITIKVWNEEDAICISIEDNGEGISKRNLKKIFYPFFSTKRTKKNWGMGLAYVKSWVEIHGGIIDVVSRENMFTMFQIWLPRSMRDVNYQKGKGKIK